MNNLDFIPEFQNGLKREFANITPFFKKIKNSKNGSEILRYTLIHHWIDICGIPVSENAEQMHNAVKGFGILILKNLNNYLRSEKVYSQELLKSMGITPPKNITVPSAIFLACGIQSKYILNINYKNNNYYAEKLEPNDTGFLLKNIIQPEHDLYPLKFNIIPDHPIYPIICGHTKINSRQLEIKIEESPKIKKINMDRYLISEYNSKFTQNLLKVV